MSNLCREKSKNDYLYDLPNFQFHASCKKTNGGHVLRTLLPFILGGDKCFFRNESSKKYVIVPIVLFLFKRELVYGL